MQARPSFLLPDEIADVRCTGPRATTSPPRMLYDGELVELRARPSFSPFSFLDFRLADLRGASASLHLFFFISQLPCVYAYDGSE
jgi:hypothetical protein